MIVYVILSIINYLLTYAQFIIARSYLANLIQNYLNPILSIFPPRPGVLAGFC